MFTLRSYLIKIGIIKPNKINNNYKRMLIKRPRLLAVVFEYAKNIRPTKDDLRECLFLIQNGLRDRPQCLMCGKKPVKFHGRSYGYTRFCSSKCAQQHQDTRDKQKETLLDRYGCEHPGQSDDHKIKRQQTCIKRYGVDHHWKHPDIRQKTLNTWNERYGCFNPGQKNIPTDVLQKLNSKHYLITQHIKNKKPLSQIGKDLNVDPTTVGNYMRQHGLQTHHYTSSHLEQEICDAIQEIDRNIIVERNSRKIISPKEIDIFLPEYNLAIEVCGLYWHSEHQGKTRLYHANKMKMCAEKNIRLITLYEDEWLFKSSIVISTLRHLLKRNLKTVYARNTTTKFISPAEKRTFFDQYHIQGSGPGSITLGLFQGSELVAAATFISKQNGVFILNRYATSINVVGGFGKLLHSFQQQYDWRQIISFADLRWSNGNLYRHLGWTLDRIIPPDYYYVDGLTRFHKFAFRRRYLPKKLERFDPLLSETQNCKLNGLWRIWDCGKQRWVLNHK